MHENTVQFNHDDHFTVVYDNNEAGIGQHFIIQQPATAMSMLKVQLQAGEGWDAIYQSTSGIAFKNKDQVIRYNDLQVLDAKNNKLPAHFNIRHNLTEIVVDAANAVYPLSVKSIVGSYVARNAKSLLQPNQIGAKMGTSVAGAGDVNGDGYNDVIIGAPYYTNGQSQEGAVFVYYGSAPNGINPNFFTLLEKNIPNGRFGNYIAGGGDVNGDGFDDVIVGAPYRTDSSATDTGAVYVYYGSASGMTTTPDIIHSIRQGDHFGISVAIVKDVDADGIDDIAIGADNSDGYVTIIYGSTWGVLNSFSTEIAIPGTTGFGTRVADGGDVNGDDVNEVMVVAGEDLYIFRGDYQRGISADRYQTILRPNGAAGFGCSIAGGGDANNDGFDDILVGAKDSDDPEEGFVQSGTFYVFLGSDTGTISVPSLIAPGKADSAHYGSQVAFAGDINNDGNDDVLSASPSKETRASLQDEGVVLLYYGYNADPGVNFWVTASIRADLANAQLGSSIAGLGDVNADGYEDFVIGAPQFAIREANEGAGLVFLGESWTSGRMAGPSKDSVVAIKPATTTKANPSAVVRLFPNPVMDNVSVQFDNLNAANNTSIQLMDMNGGVVKTIQLGKVNNGNQSIDVSTLVPGTYVVLIQNGNKVVRQKIIKQ
ncbi:T9SS type A sorting domain-containing protein [Chitinophaga sp. S165]|uniref:T9SS type A sorting domain-containing protein n=1 Tax=Chitinophaga sp. S165 TaxID=2135462 RepID=UPI0013048094|nr:T9SS type A sorting domain-containing protein [Chitinophaga sp. S165]